MAMAHADLRLSLMLVPGLRDAAVWCVCAGHGKHSKDEVLDLPKSGSWCRQKVLKTSKLDCEPRALTRPPRTSHG